MTARTPAPDQQIHAQITDTIKVRAFGWRNSTPRLDPGKYADRAVIHLVEAIAPGLETIVEARLTFERQLRDGDTRTVRLMVD